MLFLAFILLAGLNTVQAQVSGLVFQDFNSNGVYETTGTLTIADGTTIPTAKDMGITGVIVNAYNSSNTLIASYTTDAMGNYSIPASGAYNGTPGSNTGSVASGVAVRIEFVNLPTGYEPAPVGTNNNSSVRFVTGGATAVDLGINKPWEHSEDNPNFITNCFVPLANNGVNSGMDVMVAVPNSAGSSVYSNGVACTPPACPIGYNLPGPTHIATHAQIGSTWGLAWQSTTKTIYAGAFVRQFSDLGPDGTGAIYKIDVSNLASPVVTGVIDLNAIFGANTAGINPFVPYPDYNIPADRNRVKYSVFKTGLGDVDISEDESEIYAVNLHDHKIYTIPVDGSTIDNTTIQVSPTIPVPELHPSLDPAIWNTPDSCFQFALAVKNGKVYIAAQNVFKVWSVFDVPSYLTRLSIFEYDPAANTFNPTPIFTYNNIPIDSHYDLANNLLTDFNFDADGGITFCFRARASDRDGGTGGSFLLKACSNGSGGYSIEKNGTCGSGSYVLPLYYQNINPTDAGTVNSNGGIASLPGTTMIVNTMYDPFRNFSAGITWHDFEAGTYVKGMEIVPVPTIPPTSGVSWTNKSGVLGELEAISEPAPVEVGNRVWTDTNMNGIQDPNEAGLNGVSVTLWKNVGGTFMQIASTTTTGGGLYGFSNRASGSGTGFAYGVVDLVQGMEYQLRFPVTISGSAMTTKDSGGDATNNNKTDLNDSDASTSTGIVQFTVALAGANNHTFDVGYIIQCTQPSAPTFTQVAPGCTGATALNNGTITLTAVTNGTHFGISTLNAGSYDGPTTVAGATAITLPQLVKNNIPNTGGSYIVRIFNGMDDCFLDQTVTVAPVTCNCPPSACGSSTAVKN